MPVNVIDTIKPKGEFPVVEAVDVDVDGKKLTEVIEDLATSENLEAVAQELTNKADKSELAEAERVIALKADKAEIEETTTELQNQINNIIAPVTQDAELQNLRIGVDGKSYPTAKSRVDAEITNVKEDLINTKSEIYSRESGEPVTLQLSGFEFIARGNLKNDGTINLNPSSSNAVFKMYLNGLKSFDIICNTLPSVQLVGCAFFNKSGSVIPKSTVFLPSTSTKTSVVISDNIPKDGYMIINWFNYFTEEKSLYYSEISNAVFSNIFDDNSERIIKIVSPKVVSDEKVEQFDKISYARTYNETTDLNLNEMIFVANGVISTSGDIVPNPKSNHAIFKINTNGIKSFEIISNTIPENAIVCCAYYDESGNVVPYSVRGLSRESEKTVIQTPETAPDNGYIQIVWFGYASDNQNEYYSKISNVVYRNPNESIIDDVEEIILPVKSTANKAFAEIRKDYALLPIDNLEFYDNGYITYQGVINRTTQSHAIYTTSAKNIKSIAFKSNTELLDRFAFGAVYASNGIHKKTFINNGTTEIQKFNLEGITEDDDIIYIVWYAYETSPEMYYNTYYAIDYPLITDTFHEEITDIAVKATTPNYQHCVKKPYNFNGKSIQFFGDSITYGYITGGTQAANQYPKVFAQAVGATYVNSGISGSTLTKTESYPCIFDRIESVLDTAKDFVFISGGINDWQTGVDSSNLKTAMINICEYLKENYSGEVIFITPINHAGRFPITSPTQTIDSVRKIITEIALTYGYSVVQGWEFPFPTEIADSDYINAMFQDKIHPTELGYTLYAQALRNALC